MADAVAKAYAAKLDSIIASGDKLDAAAAKEVYRLIAKARGDVARILADAPSDWKLTHYGVLKARIDKVLEDFRSDFGRAVAQGTRSRWADGAELTDEMLAEFGGEAKMLAIPMDRRQLAALNGIGADQVTNLTDEVMADIGLKLKLGIISGKTPFDVMKDIGRALVDEDGNPAPGVFGDVMTRAEVIVRTEQGRAYAVAQQSRLEDWERRQPGLQKFWLAVGDDRTRPSHLRAGEEYGRDPGADPGPIGVDEKYILRVLPSEDTKSLPAGEYECKYPRDPLLPPGLSVQCRCQSLAWRAEWFKYVKTREAIRYLREAAREMTPCGMPVRRAA